MPWSQVFDGSGNTLAGAKLYFYQAGTSTLKNIYADIDLTTALSNPVIANAGGRFAPIYFDGLSYKVALYSADDVLIWTADNVQNETSESDATIAIEAIKQTSQSAGYTSAEAENPDNFPKAVYKYANGANYYNETGNVDNTYVLESLESYERPTDYFTGQQIIFVCNRPNTGSVVTVNIDELGSKSVKASDGSNLIAGDVYGLVHLVYNGTVFLLSEQNTGAQIGDIKSSIQSANHGRWLLCDGQAVSRTDYSALFTLIGENFGNGDGSTTFNVPDYRGKFLRGLGGDSAADVYTTQAEGLPNIEGEFSGNGLLDGGNPGASATGAFKIYSVSNPGADGYGSQSNQIGFDASGSNAIYGASNHVTPVNMAVNYFIKAL